MAFHKDCLQFREQKIASRRVALVIGGLPDTVERIVDPLMQAGLGVDFCWIGQWDLSDRSRKAIAIVVLDLADITAESVNFVTELRCSGVDVPLITIVARMSDAMAAQMFAAGADAILPAPVEAVQLVARCRAIVGRTTASKIVRVGSLQIEAAMKTMHVGDHKLDLSIKQYALLEHLARRAGQIATRQLLLDCLYGGIDMPNVGVIDFFIHAIRLQLKAAHSATQIETVRGAGYRLVA